jgi:hypothetical protein
MFSRLPLTVAGVIAMHTPRAKDVHPFSKARAAKRFDELGLVKPRVYLV